MSKSSLTKEGETTQNVLTTATENSNDDSQRDRQNCLDAFDDVKEGQPLETGEFTRRIEVYFNHEYTALKSKLRVEKRRMDSEESDDGRGIGNNNMDHSGVEEKRDDVEEEEEKEEEETQRENNEEDDVDEVLNDDDVEYEEQLFKNLKRAADQIPLRKFYFVPRFGRTDHYSSLTFCVALLLLPIQAVASLIGIILSVEKWLLFILALSILLLTSVTEVAADKKVESIGEAIKILAIIQSALITISKMFDSGGLNSLGAPTPTKTTAFLVALFQSTDTKEKETKRRLGLDNLDSEERGTVAKARSEMDVYFRQIVRFNYWYEFISSEGLAGSDNDRQLKEVISELEKDRIRMSTWSVVEALDWAKALEPRNSFNKRYWKLISIVEAPRFFDFVAHLAENTDLSVILDDESLSVEDIIRKSKLAHVQYQEEKMRVSREIEKSEVEIRIFESMSEKLEKIKKDKINDLLSGDNLNEDDTRVLNYFGLNEPLLRTHKPSNSCVCS